ncbi:YicC family protein [Nitrosococcus wardiae]|uniref:YicC family protein n=2 Tax=Nitrosococcus wardiae TaxID=1814290 RepID=A0A4P7BXN7_9GAMM|nr:YicC family protein [Nitrosococcus wardiae]
MIYSMTAFARQGREGDAGTFTWELRSVNHRYLDISVRLPEELRFIESQVRALVSNRLRRGKVDCALRYFSPSAAAVKFSLDEQLTRQLVHLCEEIDALAPHPAPLNSLEVLRWPGVLKSPALDVERLKTEALSALEDALNEMLATRAAEGARLVVFMTQRCGEIEAIVERVRAQLPQAMSRFRERLHARLETVQTELEPGRLEQELVLFAQRSDITEELDRLQAHMAEVRQVFQRKEPVGRRLDFLMQELNREANTLAAKSVDVAISQDAVELKVLIEQVREQVQNIE